MLPSASNSVLREPGQSGSRMPVSISLALSLADQFAPPVQANSTLPVRSPPSTRPFTIFTLADSRFPFASRRSCPGGTPAVCNVVSPLRTQSSGEPERCISPAWLRNSGSSPAIGQAMSLQARSASSTPSSRSMVAAASRRVVVPGTSNCISGNSRPSSPSASLNRPCR